MRSKVSTVESKMSSEESNFFFIKFEDNTKEQFVLDQQLLSRKCRFELPELKKVQLKEYSNIQNTWKVYF